MVSHRGDQMVQQIYDKSKCLPVDCAHENPRAIVQQGWGVWNPQNCLKIVTDAQGARFQVGAWQLPWARLWEVVFKDVLRMKNFILHFVSKSAHEEITGRSACVGCSLESKSTQHNLTLSCVCLSSNKIFKGHLQQVQCASSHDGHTYTASWKEFLVPRERQIKTPKSN